MARVGTSQDPVLSRTFDSEEAFLAALNGWEGLGPDDPESGRARGEPKPERSASLLRELAKRDEEQNAEPRRIFEEGRKAGQAETKARARARRDTSSTSTPHRVAQRIRAAAPEAVEAAAGRPTSWSSILLGMLALTFLYFALTHAGVISSFLNLVRGAFTWLLDPHATL